MRSLCLVSRPLVGATLLFGLAAGSLACSQGDDAKTKAAPPSSAAAVESAATPTPSAIEPAPHADGPDSAPAVDPGPPLPAAEAHRTTLRKLAEDKGLAPHEALLQDHFGNPISFPLAVQAAPLAGGGRALLFQSAGKDHNPFILVLDGAGQSLWIKERPLAGIVPGVTEMVLVAAAKGDVLLSWFDPPSKIIAARHWDARGSILVDFPLLHADACSALAGLHWPGQGFVIAAATSTAARIQLLDEQGTLAFGGEEGIELPWTSRADVPVSIAVDSGPGVTFFQAGHAGAAKAGAPPDHLLAARFDANGKALWSKPLVVGPVSGAATERVALTVGSDGNVTIPKLGVTVTPGGSVIASAGKR